MNSKIIVATHKAYDFPQHELYIPMQVGRAASAAISGYLGDDTGENISSKNQNYSELTALYWVWKNHFFKDDEYCGLVHYRRYFSGTAAFCTFKILDEKDIECIMSVFDVIVPVKRNYYIETVRSHYAHAHHKEDLDELENILRERSPEYLDAFERVMGQRSLYLYNMFVMRTEHCDAYCAWLFPILFELEKRIDISGYDAYQSRVFGFLSERLFNVWLLHHRLKVKEVKVINFEGENMILKAMKMLQRKYLK